MKTACFHLIGITATATFLASSLSDAGGTSYSNAYILTNIDAMDFDKFPALGDGGHIAIVFPAGSYGACGVCPTACVTCDPNATVSPTGESINQNLIVGIFYPPFSRAVRIDADNSYTKWVLDISPYGVCVGRATTMTNFVYHAFRTDNPPAAIADLHPSNPPNKPTGCQFCTYDSSIACAIDSSSRIALTIGNWNEPDSRWNSSHAYMRSPDGMTLTDIRPTSGDSVTYALGMNDSGSIVGFYNPNSPATEGNLEDERAFRWTNPNVFVDLGTLPSGGGRSRAFGANELGWVVGWAKDAFGSFKPVLWVSSNQISELPLLPGDNSGVAYAINNCGMIVGFSEGPEGRRAVRWDPAPTIGIPHDLTTQISTLAEVELDRAVDINSQGWILCIGHNLPGPETNSNQRAMLIRPNKCPSGSCFGDANGDGVVDFADITDVLTNFGLMCF